MTLESNCFPFQFSSTKLIEKTIIQKKTNSFLNSVSYRIDNVIIDPGDEWLEENDIDVILLTHAHFDHIYGINRILRKNPTAKIYTNKCGYEMLLNSKKNLSAFHETPFVVDFPDNVIVTANYQEVNLRGDIKAKAIFTPGHNPSCITWIIEDLVFTGDSYIPGVKTITTLPGGNKKQSEESINIINQISINHKIYPGHKI